MLVEIRNAGRAECGNVQTDSPENYVIPSDWQRTREIRSAFVRSDQQGRPPIPCATYASFVLLQESIAVREVLRRHRSKRKEKAKGFKVIQKRNREPPQRHFVQNTDLHQRVMSWLNDSHI